MHRAAPYAGLPRSALEASARHAVRVATPRMRSPSSAPAPGLGSRHRRTVEPTGGRPATGGHQRRHHPRSRVCSASSWPVPPTVRRVRRDESASSTRRWSTSPGSATSSCSDRRRGASRRSRTPSVLVTPAPGQVGRMPFWKGDAPGRPVPNWGARWARSSARSSSALIGRLPMRPRREHRRPAVTSWRRHEPARLSSTEQRVATGQRAR